MEPYQLDELHAELCKVFTHPTRIRILELLRDGEVTVGALADALDVAQPHVSQHLTVMRNAGVLDNRRHGPNVYYRLTDPRIVDAFDTIREVLTERLDGRARPVRRRTP